MKIERINDNQIRCFISSEDLAQRKIKISELAYGTDKAKQLFHEMISFANKEYGFDSDNMPLMIEAIPFAQDGLLLTITKVEFPDELDSRFSYFSDSDISDVFGSASQSSTGKIAQGKHSFPKSFNANDIINVCSSSDAENNYIIRHFKFSSLDEVIMAARVVSKVYCASNSLYKDKSGNFHLILSIGNHSASKFNKVCNCLSEYGIMETPDNNSYKKIEEHSKLIVAVNAIELLSML